MSTRVRICSMIILLSAFLETAQGQPMLTAGRNQMRTYDKLKLHAISADMSMNASMAFVLDLSNGEVGKKVFARTYSTTIVPDTLTVIAFGSRDYYVPRGDSVLLVGMENPQTRIIYDMPELWQRFPMMLGDSVGGYYNGTGKYCDRLFLRKFGTYTTKAEALGSIVLPKGDTLRNVLRLHTKRYISTVVASIDTLHHEIPAFTVDSIRLHAAVDSSLLREDIWRYYAPGYRYPVVETTTLRDGVRPNSVPYSTSTYYYPPEEQELLALDEENLTVRRVVEEFGSQPAQNGKDNGFKYTAVQDEASHNIVVDYSLIQPVEIRLWLCDVQGTAWQSERRQGVAGMNRVKLNYSGLRSGQYVLYISVSGQRYSQKFNVPGN